MSEDHDFIQHLKLVTEEQARYIERLEVCLLLTYSYHNSQSGIRLGRKWLNEYGPGIIHEIKVNGGTDKAARALRYSYGVR